MSECDSDMPDGDGRAKRIDIHTDGGAVVIGNVDTRGGEFTGRDHAPGEGGAAGQLEGAEYTAARERYLAALRPRYNVIQTHAFTALAQDEQIGSPRRPPLLGEEGVYVPLRFDAPPLRPEAPLEDMPADQRAIWRRAEQGSQPETLPEILQCFPGHLAITGDAGSGKTTVLHVLVSALAAEDPAAVAPDLAPVLPHPRPIPIFLPLRLFEHACKGADSTYSRCVKDVLSFVDDWFAEWCDEAALPPGFLAAHIRQGRAWLLLDALDEVPDPVHRETVRGVIEELAGEGYGTRLVVTARLAAYRHTRLDERFTVVQVRDLDDGQRTAMVHAIYRGLALPDPARRATDLAHRFDESEALQELARTPVMVWTAAAIDAYRGELPEGRAALYDAYVTILLEHSFKRTRYNVEAVEELASGQDWPLPDRRHYLTYAAFETHRLLETHPERRSERRIVVGEDELADRVLARYFAENLGYGPWEARRRAREFLSVMVERSGLIYETDEGYTIGDHLTMQEFLAGCYLGEHYALEDPAGYAAFLREKTGRTWWREVVLLAAGYLAGRPGFAARQFLRTIADQGDGPADRLAALALAGRGLLQLRAQRRRPSWYGGSARDFAGRMYQQLFAEPVDGPAAVRQEAGLVLGLLYGYPGEGELADPRSSSPQGLPVFVPVPAGWFWMGSTEAEVARLIEKTGMDYYKRELPRHRVYLGAYEVARFATTNAMFARFVADGGYRERRWWPEAIADGRWAEGQFEDWQVKRDLPAYWRDARWNNPAQPVVGVTWYEAGAYCRWLTAKLDDGFAYRLPAEAEWERAARGSQGWRYPWGDEWIGDRCNSEEAGLGATSPVGLFARGAAEGGIEDMAGNVWEWCRDWYAGETYASSEGARNPSGPASGRLRVTRGGSWYSDGPHACRCGCRSGVVPGSWFDDWGFRCVRTSP